MILDTKGKFIPPALQNIEQWRLSRRKLMKGMLAAGILSQIPLAWSCSSFRKPPATDIFTAQQLKIVRRVQQILFPDDGFGPGATAINADKYLTWVLSDPRMDPDDKDYVFKGIKWISETAVEEAGKDFLVMAHPQQEKLIRKISRTDWGESWLSIMLTYILEALIADPQYGGNPDGNGWNWLHHYPGYPRPTKELLYGNILNTMKKQYEQKI